MQFIEMLPGHKIGDIIIFKSDKPVDNEEMLVQSKIVGATAILSEGKWVWSYQVQPIHGDLSIFLEDIHIIANLTK